MSLSQTQKATLIAGAAAEKIAQAANAAYWLRSYEHEGADYQLKIMGQEFAKLIAEMAKLGVTPQLPTAEQFTHHAQSAFDDACPEEASGYEVGQAWKAVGKSLSELAVEQFEETAEIATSGYLHLGKAGAGVAMARDTKVEA